MSKESDRLEEEGKLEVCQACLSVHILETNNGVICGSCGTENYTTEIPEDGYTTLKNFNNNGS